MNGYEVKSAIRVLEILDLLGRVEKPLPLMVIASEFGYPKSSTFHLLSTLVSLGYITQDDRGGYSIHQALKTGHRWENGYEAELIAIARPIIGRLKNKIGETVFLGLRRKDGRVKTLVKDLGYQRSCFDCELPLSDPAYCTAMGRILLAYWSPEKTSSYLARERIIKITKYTVIDRIKIRRILEQVVNNGFAICDEETVVGGSAVAAPVRNSKGQVVAALNIATPSARFSQMCNIMIEEVTEFADKLSHIVSAREK